MFSVIIPTMWRSHELERALPLLDMCPAIGEILLINNDIPNTPQWLNRPWDKLKVYTPPSNIFVNPAFNYGIKNSTYDKICLLQDDILFDTNIFNMIHNSIVPTVGCVGFNAEYLVTRFPDQLEVIPIKNIEVCELSEIKGLKGGRIFGYACIMFLHKDNYIPIDETLKIHLGEEWICYTHEKMGKPPLVLRGFYATASNVMTTSSFGTIPKVFGCRR